MARSVLCRLVVILLMVLAMRSQTQSAAPHEIGSCTWLWCDHSETARSTRGAVLGCEHQLPDSPHDMRVRWCTLDVALHAITVTSNLSGSQDWTSEVDRLRGYSVIEQYKVYTVTLHCPGAPFCFEQL